MKRITQFEIYRLGVVRLLNWVRIGDRIVDRLDEFFFTHIALAAFSNDAQSKSLLPNSAFEAGSLASFISTIIDEAKAREHAGLSFPLLTPAGELTPHTQQNLLRGIAAFETVLRHELEGLPTYIIEKIGIYDSDDMLTKADAAIVSPLNPFIPPKALEDFKKAGAALAFELYTASGFHGYRAVDATLKSYHQHFVGALPTNQRDWGSYIRGLREMPTGGPRKPNSRTIELLDRIRAEDRNPLIHPETDLDATEANLAFDLCRTAITFMALDIKNAP